MLSTLEQTLCARIAARKPQLLEDLRLHVNLPTGGSGPALDESRERLTTRLAALGAHVQSIPGDSKPAWLLGETDTLQQSSPSLPTPPLTAVCERTAGLSGSRILLSGHIDTVHDPASEFRELSISPDKKTATGPGCVDMKGGLVIAVAALEALEEVGVKAPWSFVLSSDEETGSFACDRTLREQAALHDFGLALEPALPDGALVIERPGSAQFMIEAIGRSAHVGRDFVQGVSAINALAAAVERVSHWADPNPKPPHGLILNVGVLKGGTATNVVPELARAWGNLRFFDQQTAAHAIARLETLRTPSGSLPEIRVFHTLNRPAKPSTPMTLHLAELARAAAEALGQKLPFGKTGGVCEGNNLQAVGLPTIDTLGVRGGGLHTKTEWIELESLVERCQLLAVLIGRLAGLSSHAA